jgi:hypothetical protein
MNSSILLSYEIAARPAVDPGLDLAEFPALAARRHLHVRNPEFVDPFRPHVQQPGDFCRRE